MSDENNSYIKLDDDLIDDYQPAVPPVIQEGGDGEQHQQSVSHENIDTEETMGAETGLDDIGDQMARIAIDSLNRKREQTHNDIDGHYDGLIASVREKIDNLSREIAEGVANK
ncbi:hypothetical protein FWH30_00085 [Microgenomates group bacterium]|nr:hypothetical protein [Microgenomates group bacterium]